MVGGKRPLKSQEGKKRAHPDKPDGLENKLRKV
jgi:hypothetical protein